MEKIAAKEFYDIFTKQILVDEKYPKCGKSEREFTNKVNEVIKKIIKSDSQEYYRVDHTDFSVEEDEESRRVGLYPNKWILKALVEHENKTNDWNYEVYKLAPFKCPLRVVIGYVEKDQREKDLEKLSVVAENLHFMEDNDCFCPDGEFLIILGNDGWEEADYRAYIYENRGFREL